MPNASPDDPHRPRYHFTPPANWMNDPNGAMFWKGQHHVFYQYNPNGSFHDTIHWGHAVSADLVHWTHLPVALTPTPGEPDSGGCWSGGPAIDNNGIPTIAYHGRPGGICIASSRDDLMTWEKWPENPVIPAPSEDRREWRVSAPCVWKESETWYLISGSYVGKVRALGVSRDAAFLFRSRDLTHWEYMHRLYDPGNESDCAVPSFFPLGGKHVLLFASHTRGCQYYIGTYRDQKFTPERHGRMNFTGFTGFRRQAFCSGDLIAPICWADGRDRRIMTAWIAEGRTVERQREAGWAGVMSLPRLLSLRADGSLRIVPVPELQALRRNHRRFTGLRGGPGNFCLPLKEIEGDCLEIAAVIDPGDAETVGLKLRCSPVGDEETLVVYDPAKQHLTLDVTRSSPTTTPVNRNPQTGPLTLADNEPLKLHIFVDRSVIEVFANDRQCLTKRIYPSIESVGTAFVTRGGCAAIESIDAWNIEPTCLHGQCWAS